MDLKLDHITLFARTLASGAAHIKDTLGIDMPNGGTHPRMGTHNMLLPLGDETFLEVIAIDPSAKKPDRPRWFGLDHFNSKPFLGHWVVATDDIRQALVHAHPKSGPAIEMTRGNLTWQISVPDEGTMPLDGAFPSFIEWQADPHPARNMTDLGCRLRSLTVTHPNAHEIEALIGNRIDCDLINIQTGPHKSIRASISTPSGIRELT